MKLAPSTTGRLGEYLAYTYLQLAGLQLVKKNFHCRHGEIDLIMQQEHTCVFVEVKTRTSSTVAQTLGSITPVKQQRLIKTSDVFLQRHPTWYHYDLRFDVVVVIFYPPVIEWYADAFNLDT